MDSPASTAPPSTGSNRAAILSLLGLAIVGGLVMRGTPSGPVTNPVAATVQASAPVSPGMTALASATDAKTLSPAMRGEFEALIKDYLIRNPEVMLDVQSALEAKMEKINAEKTAAALKEHAKELFEMSSAPSAGNPKGDVTVVEFFDYNCGYCKKALPDLASLVQSDKNVRVILKEFPILSKGSEEASKIAIAARMQGKYWDFHLAMLGLQGQANEASALKVAEKTGLDMARLKKDMASEQVKKEIDDTRALAQKMGINGTPHFLVGDKTIAGAPENLAEVLAGNIADVRKAGGCKVCGG